MSRWSLVLLGLWVGCGSSAPLSLDAATPGDAFAPDVPGAADAPGDSASVTDAALVADAGPALAEASAPVDRAPDVSEEALLVASPTAYSFPAVVIGEESPAAPFVATNLGVEATGPISHVIDGSNEFVVTSSTCGQPLLQQRTCEARVVFKPITAGQKQARLIFLASPGKMFTVLLVGTAQQPAGVRLAPTVYDFPTTAIPTPANPLPMSPMATFTVTNHGGQPAGPVSVQLTGADFAIADNACEGAVLMPQATCAIQVRFRPTTAGPRTGTLEAKVPGLQVPPAALSGIGGEAARIAVQPADHGFGSLQVGQKSVFTFDVTNEGGAEAGKLAFVLEGMNITEFSAAGDPACDVPLGPGASCGVTVTFAPTIPGTKTASLRVAGSPGGFVKVGLTGMAFAANGQLSLTSPSPDPFGTVAVGTSTNGFFMVENKGLTSVGMVLASISGGTAGEFTVTDNACPASLAPGAQCGLTVKFSPQLSGRRTANLQITALPGGFATLPLSGNATAGDGISVSPTSRNFGARPVGSQTGLVQELTVRFFGPSTTGPLSVGVEGADGDNFQVTLNDCQGTTLSPARPTCRVGVRFVPLSAGQKSASLRATALPGGTARASLLGQGT
jgi:hypothetical protein